MSYTYPKWIQEEFKTIDFGDVRLTKRFKYIVSEFMKKAQSNISSIFDSWSSIKGCYRFFDNEKVNSKDILSEHINAYATTNFFAGVCQISLPVLEGSE